MENEFQPRSSQTRERSTFKPKNYPLLSQSKSCHSNNFPKTFEDESRLKKLDFKEHLQNT